MNSVYLVRNDEGKWLSFVDDSLCWGELKHADAFPLRLARFFANTHAGSTVVEFVPRSETEDLAMALRAAYDSAVLSDLPDGELERIVALLSKWEPAA